MKILKLSLCLFALLLLSAAAALAQTPYPSLSFEKQQNADGTVDYVLRPIISEIHKRVGGPDKTYRMVGAVVRPATKKAVLLLLNAQEQFQLEAQTVKSVVITADTTEINNLTYDLVAKGKVDSPIKFEIGNTLMSLDNFEKIANANSVVVKFGAVVHQLDKDNRDALHYLVGQIQKDQKTN
jgi:hypothetical protein